VATAWRIDGKLTHEFPMTLEEVARAEPIYEVLPGWSEDVSGVRSYATLPANARRYVERIESLVGVPIDVISVGPDRDQTITRRTVF
jgi:adenylosuccinate synthase